MNDKPLEVNICPEEEPMCLNGSQRYVLRLYIAGSSPRSMQAIAAVKEACTKHLGGCCDLEVVDIYQQPVLKEGEKIIAVPTLVKRLPLPMRKIIGEIASTEQVLVGLDLLERPECE